MLTTPEITKLAKEIAKDAWNSHKDMIDLERVCEEKLKHNFPLISNLQVPEIFEDLLSKVKYYINKEITSYVNKGITPTYEFNDYPPNMLLSHSLKHKEDIRLTFLRKHHRELGVAIKQMDWRIFEYLCKHLLQINGVIKSFVTRGTKEGGIDFYGLLDIDKSLSGILLKGLKVRIIGQAKCYSKEVGESWIRKFYTHYEDFLNTEGRGIKILPKWFIEIKSPVIAIFATTSTFTKGAVGYANKKGIILREGDQIVEDLLHSPKSDNWFQRSENGSLIFDQESFVSSFNE
jgi:hypothetical protein